jgi:hypothetical protein
LIDTPGFNDTFLDDAAILAQLSAFMESTYRAKVKLTAIIYLHPIVNDRLEGSALSNLSMFRKLCGPKFYPNIVLATTFWSRVSQSLGSQREAQLRENAEFWGSMLKRGSQIVRLPDDREESIALLLSLAGKAKAALQIQEELVDRQLLLSQTEAGANAKNVQALEDLRKEFTQKLLDLAAARKAELQRQQAQFAKIRAEQEKAFEAQLRKQKEELEEIKKAQEALIRQAEERRKKALEEQAELVRQTQLETEKLKSELERLAIKDEQEQVIRRRVEKEEEFERRKAAIFKQMKDEEGIFKRAMASGRLKATIDTSWWYELHLGRICNICLHSCSAHLYYSEWLHLSNCKTSFLRSRVIGNF